MDSSDPPGRRQKVGAVEQDAYKHAPTLHPRAANSQRRRCYGATSIRCGPRDALHTTTQQQSGGVQSRLAPLTGATRACRVVVLILGFTNRVPNAKATMNSWMKR